jgi:hypothetical protein
MLIHSHGLSRQTQQCLRRMPRNAYQGESILLNPSSRRQCDRLEPTCGQCARLKRVCSGYRNQLDLMFVNESKDISRKTNRPTKREARKSGGSSRSVTNDFGTLVGTRILSPSLFEQSTNFFFRSFVFPHPNPTRTLGSHYAMLRTQVGDDEPVAIAISCLGMAGLARQKGSPALAGIANRRYAMALNMTNSAMRDPVAVRSDQTLAVVNLLGMFEVCHIVQDQINKSTSSLFQASPETH